MPAALGRLGGLVTRLAAHKSEIVAAQRVRYRVFCEEFSAKTEPANEAFRSEQDAHDQRCDHLVVLDPASPNKSNVIGTQRFLVRKSGDEGGFSSQPEFDVETLIDRFPKYHFMELGRSCILPDYRSKRTMELMWQGTWAYALERQVDVMIGCASFHTANPDEVMPALSFLQSIAPVDSDWSVTPVADPFIQVKPVVGAATDMKSGLRLLPPLIKGYLRLGAMFSEHAVVDETFGTTDVLVILPVNRINPKYVNYYGADASKHRD